MASEHQPGKTGPRRPDATRHIYGPRPVAALMPALVRPAFKRHGGAAVTLMTDWDVIVGPAIAAVTRPRRLFSGTLTIVCSGPVALELQHVASALMVRINGHVGRVAVTRLRFMQDVPPPPAAPVPAPRPKAVQAARDAVASLPEGALRDALEALGRAVLARS
jgi:hypothetical protein